MALFRKKSQADGEDAAATQFAPQPEKARKWFSHAKTMADSFSYDSALVYYAEGIKLDPEPMSAHEAMYEVAIKYMNKGGKPAAGKEVRSIDDGGPVAKFAAAEFAWMKDLDNAPLAVKALDAAVKAGQLEFGNWAAGKVFTQLRKGRKNSKGLWVQAMGLFREVAAWNEAIAAGEQAVQLDPTDGELAAEIKNLSAQRAMDQGGYERSGEEGGYRGSVRDIEKQRELEEAEAITGSQSMDERNLERAREAYEETPAVPDVINRYAQLLRKEATPEAEEQAYEIFMKGFSETGEYRFRMAAGDIRIDQARRQVTETERGIEQAREQAPPGASPDEAVAPLAARLTEARKHLLDLQAGEYRQRAEKYPTDRALRFRLGEAEFELGNIADAMACFQSAKDEPKFKVRSGHLLGRCFASESWHVEAIGEYKEALAALDATEKERELAIRYDLMVSLLAHARAENSVDLAREALEICSSIARKDITFRDIRDRRREVDTLLKELSGGG